MFGTRTFILLNFLYISIECLIPHLNVRKMDTKVIAQKRQDTLDMCRYFNAETEHMKYHQGFGKHGDIMKHRRRKRFVGESYRVKRDVLNSMNPALNDEDAQRIEDIVEKIYDDLDVKGNSVAYNNFKHSGNKPKLNKTDRRFNFAPADLLGPLPVKIPTKLNSQSFSEKSPRFKHGIVPYFIDSNTYDSHLSDIITSVFDYIEKATCIRLQRLRERPTDVDSLRNVVWLYITNPVGIRQCVHSNDRIDIEGVQMITFGYDCMSLGDISHEVMHVLGFSHEHTRPDRDQYITILWDNIKPGYKKYFEAINKPAVDMLPYDYASVLHYPPRAFSRNGKVTILTEPGLKIGQREGFSELDVEKISTTYSAECVKRNREYLLKTCPTVVKADTQQKNVTPDEIADYFNDRLWPYGVVNFKLSDNMEFSSEERENINAVIRHIEKETCIEFRDLTTDPNNEVDDTSSSDENTEFDRFVELTASTGLEQEKAVDHTPANLESEHNETEIEIDDTLKESDNEIKKSDEDNTNTLRKNIYRRKDNIGDKMKKELKGDISKHLKSAVRAKRSQTPASRRHANAILVLSRSPEPGCVCPHPGKPSGIQVIKINSGCFNSANDLLHMFAHVLGLDHQHNMHDRDSFLHVVWDQLTPDVKAEMKNKLPAAASVGFSYDYQSVMHYPWLQIKDGRTNIMYPVWNDGWAMGHWQGLSSIDVQKLNLLYLSQCTERKKQVEEAGIPSK